MARPPIRFSSRIPARLGPNPLTRARRRLGRVPFDLTVSNPTRCQLPYPEDLLVALAAPHALVYEPQPRGLQAARQAVAATYHAWDLTVDPERILLTASTSEAYGFLFRALADPGQVIMVPTPSYPLFEHLARLEGVAAVPYRLDPDDGFRVDPASLAAAPPSTRAVVVVHPNNPTGSFVHPEDAARVVALCAERGWALIADEVFLPFPLAPAPGSDRSFAACSDCLCVALGGLSKSAGLPQLKLAWMVINGPPAAVEAALEALDYVADAYLSVSTPVAVAAPELIARGATVAAAIRERCRRNLETLHGLAATVPAVSVLAPAGGWSVVLRVPTVSDEETLAVRLLERRGVGVFPGYFFDFAAEGHLVLSLLPPEATFTEGVRRLLEEVEESLA